MAIVGFVFLPAEKIFLWRLDGAVAKTFRVVAGEHKLVGGKEPGIELWLLIRKILADAIANAHTAALELDHADGNAIDIDNEVWTPLLWPFESYFLGYGKIIGLWVMPIDQGDRCGGLIGGSFDLNSVAQQRVDLPIGFIEALLAYIRRPSELIQGATDLSSAVATSLENAGENLLLDIAVTPAVFPVTEISVAELFIEKLDHPLLGGALKTQPAHGTASRLRISRST